MCVHFYLARGVHKRNDKPYTTYSFLLDEKGE